MLDKKKELAKLVEEHNVNEIRRFIVENDGFDFCFTNNKGQTLLHLASRRISENTLPLIQILLGKGIDPLSVDESFVSAIDLADKEKNMPALSLMKHFINGVEQEIKSLG